MLYTVNAFASCTVLGLSFSLIIIMKIYFLCIRAREREEVEKKVQKIKALLILYFMAFYAHV